MNALASPSAFLPSSAFVIAPAPAHPDFPVYEPSGDSVMDAHLAWFSAERAIEWSCSRGRLAGVPAATIAPVRAAAFAAANAARAAALAGAA
jgi:hypothetical protein